MTDEETKIDGSDQRDALGAEFLARLAVDVDADCGKQFDALYYPLVWRYLRANHTKLGPRVARYLKVDGVTAPQVLEEEVAEVAHDATLLALRRVREDAARFDPSRGTATGWVIGRAEFAWVEVAKTIVAARRSDSLLFVAPEDLLAEADPSPTTEEHVLRHVQNAEAMEDAASHLTKKEWVAVRLVVTHGYSYAEVAKVIFGDETMTRQVDGLIQRGKAKLAEAWNARRPSPSGAGGANVSDRTDDKEGTDG